MKAPRAISGWNGNDLLLGYNGRDILSGGAGIDRLNLASATGSDAGDDILIGGKTNYDYSQAAVAALIASWSSASTYTGHINQLFTIGVGSSKQYKLNIASVLDDSASDILFGAVGSDWYFAKSSGAT